MATVWKVMLGLAVVLPVAAYALGSLVASASNAPVERAPIVINDPSPRETSPSSDGPDTPGNGSPGPQIEDNRVDVVTPPPTRVGDDDDWDDRDEDDDDDDDRDDDDRDDD
ncbi:hypothetical protein [Nocardioides sp.]|uniref:hypothetical protein n=1 Tax=Nocardioides sp. TaxID=35761 RepID=UPI002735FB3A|nr:hypothetical protein [Nocardioides sp.]MDP3894499.1 hypothetical protein [Nocardioides sp.]